MADATVIYDKNNYVILSQSRQTVKNSQPLFSVGNNALAGYISVEMYKEYMGSVVHDDNDSKASQSKHENALPSEATESLSDQESEDAKNMWLYKGETYASGQPFVTYDAVVTSKIKTKVSC